MASVKFFCWNLPVVGSGPTVMVGDEPFKFWTVEGDRGEVTFRTKVRPDGTCDVQQRLDDFLWKGDSNGGMGLAILGAKRIVPAKQSWIDSWMHSHLWLPEVRHG